MNLDLKDKLFVVTGATSGFGLAITKQLIEEKANVILNARGEQRLLELKNTYPNQVEILVGDISTDAVIANLFMIIGNRKLSGVVVNAGGPPALPFTSTDMLDWDKAYHSILRWKVKFTHELLDKLIPQQYGRIIYIESASVKQPIENLVLSNSLRLAVVGFVKTVSQEVAHYDINLNVLAPGYHDTPAMERLFKAKAEAEDISIDEAKLIFEKQTNTNKLGDPNDFASLALWLLSPLSKYITGQTISVDGGLIKGVMG